MSEERQIIEVAHALADAARNAILPFFRRDFTTENKAADGFDPVTQADRAAEKAMRDILAQRRPRDGIIGEEFGCSVGQSGLTWILDPIDGTRAFLCGATSWGVLIAVADESGPIYGLVDQPYIGERFEGGFDRALLEGPLGKLSLKARGGRSLDQAILMTTFPEVGSQVEGAAFKSLSEKTCLTRYGLDCYAYAMLAAGQIDLVVEAGLQIYDIAAPMALVQAAGGVVTDWRGGSAAQGGRVIAAASPELHDAALAILSQTPANS